MCIFLRHFLFFHIHSIQRLLNGRRNGGFGAVGVFKMIGCGFIIKCEMGNRIIYAHVLPSNTESQFPKQSQKQTQSKTHRKKRKTHTFSETKTKRDAEATKQRHNVATERTHIQRQSGNGSQIHKQHNSTHIHRQMGRRGTGSQSHWVFGGTVGRG